MTYGDFQMVDALPHGHGEEEAGGHDEPEDGAPGIMNKLRRYLWILTNINQLFTYDFI